MAAAELSCCTQVGDHLQHFYNPRLQRLVLRVLWMPVVFGVDNWVALRWQYAGVYMTVLTGWYEAWVLYSFYTYLEGYLEADFPPGSLAQLDLVKLTPPHRHMLPCCCLVPWRMDDGQFVRLNKIGVLQYALVQTLCTAVTFATNLSGWWHDGALDARYAFIYVTVAVNISQLTALYCLVLFYHAFKEPLAPLRPLSKFLCVKLIIFFSFWQEMLVYALVYFGVIRYQQSWASTTVADVAAGIQNFLICVEMMVAAVAHSYAFPVEDYKKSFSKAQRAVRPSLLLSARMMFSVRDVLDDVATVFGVGRTTGCQPEPACLEARPPVLAARLPLPLTLTRPPPS